MERLHDACGIVGIYMPQTDRKLDVRRYITLALTALQHRGQESAGMAVYTHNNEIAHHVGMGKVREVFQNSGVDSLPETHCGIGHVRYSTTGSSCVENAGPFVVGAQPDTYETLHEDRVPNDTFFTSRTFGNDASSFSQGGIAVAHNGNLVNGRALLVELPQKLLNSTTDSEAIAWLLLNADGPTLRERMIAIFPLLHGAYSLVILAQ